MRLTNYLTEISKVSDIDVEKILDNGFKEYRRLIKKNFSLFKKLHYLKQAFLPYLISFYTSNDPVYKNVPMKGFSATGTKGTIIWLKIDKKDLKKLKTNSGANQLKRKLEDTLAHELTHRFQDSKKSQEYKEFLLKNKDKKKLQIEDYDDYISQKEEIEAFARQALYELDRGEATILQDYIDLDNKKAKQRFFKKLYQYLQMYGSNTARENFEIHLEASALNKETGMSDFLGALGLDLGEFMDIMDEE